MPYPYRDDDDRNAVAGGADGLPTQRVVRGGSFWDRPHRAASSGRRGYEAWQRVFDVGFRIIIEIDGAAVVDNDQGAGTPGS
jgi:formylglycine-generating enzyme required for sulfatase activity